MKIFKVSTVGEFHRAVKVEGSCVELANDLDFTNFEGETNGHLLDLKCVKIRGNGHKISNLHSENVNNYIWTSRLGVVFSNVIFQNINGPYNVSATSAYGIFYSGFSGNDGGPITFKNCHFTNISTFYGAIFGHSYQQGSTQVSAPINLLNCYFKLKLNSDATLCTCRSGGDYNLINFAECNFDLELTENRTISPILGGNFQGCLVKANIIPSSGQFINDCGQSIDAMPDCVVGNLFYTEYSGNNVMSFSENRQKSNWIFSSPNPSNLPSDTSSQRTFKTDLVTLKNRTDLYMGLQSPMCPADFDFDPSLRPSENCWVIHQGINNGFPYVPTMIKIPNQASLNLPLSYENLIAYDRLIKQYIEDKISGLSPTPVTTQGIVTQLADPVTDYVAQGEVFSVNSTMGTLEEVTE